MRTALCGRASSAEDPLAIRNLRSSYRSLIRLKKRLYDEQQEMLLVREAISRPYKWLRQTEGHSTCTIDPERLTEHFRSVYASCDSTPNNPTLKSWVRAEADQIAHDAMDFNWSIAEVYEAIAHLPLGKASGPDQILNEHLRQAGAMIPKIAALLNGCLDTGRIPSEWRNCLLTLISKGKGGRFDPTSWRGIAKRNVLSKLLSSLVSSKLEAYLDSKSAIPEEQFGFRRGKSTLMACERLLSEIEKSTKKNFPLYVVFVDYRTAFDTASRSKIITKLNNFGVGGRLLHLLIAILQSGDVSIEDGTAVLPEFTQTTGVAQGDNLSPQLFSVLLSDLPDMIAEHHDLVRCQLFADDLLLSSRSRRDLMRALNTLEAYSRDNDLKINTEKTKVMKYSHDLDSSCSCIFCNRHCDLYHFYICTKAKDLHTHIHHELG